MVHQYHLFFREIIMRYAKKMDSFPTSIFTELNQKKITYYKQTGNQPIDFSVGSPNIPPSPSILEVMQKEVQKPENYKYAITELDNMLTTIQHWYDTRYHVPLDTNQIVCVSGSQEALSTLCLAFCDPGDTVLVPDPCYPVFQDGPHIASAHVEYMPLQEENDYIIQLDAIDPDVAKRAKLMIVSYPNNPTCAIAPDSFYHELIAFAKKYDILVVHDNAYSELVFDGVVGKSFLEYPGAMDVGIEINSLSKTFGIAGARFGVVVGNTQMIQAYRKLKSNMDYGVFLPIQKASIEALTHCTSDIKKTCDAYQERRDVLLSEFANIGWHIQKTPATMFIWARIPDNYDDSNTFTYDLLEKAGVVVTPGLSFGQQGKHYIRIALVQDVEKIKEAAKRIQNAHLF